MRRTLTFAIALYATLFSGSAAAQETTPVVDLETAAALFVTAVNLPGVQHNDVFLYRAKRAVRQAVDQGLVFYDHRTEKSASSLYVKFGSDGMPQLRWRTRFGLL